ncbi:MAG: YCF48-related protein, partial [Bacteroides sp.]|nr:YCF48-related protein [Bacteroides sp.]
MALLTLLSVLAFVSTGQDPQWTQQSSPIGDDFVSLSIVDEMHVWIAGVSGNLLYTEDGGEHWIVQNVFPKYHFESICFSDSQHGCVVGWGGELIDSTVV